MARGRSWTPAEDDELANARSSGVPTRVVAESLDRTATAVRARARRLGLEPPPSRGTADWTSVSVQLSDARLPPMGRRSEVIRAGLDMLARMAPREGLPPTDRVVLVRCVNTPGAFAVCRWSVASVLWLLDWYGHPSGTSEKCSTPESWPASYRWHELPGGE